MELLTIEEHLKKIDPVEYEKLRAWLYDPNRQKDQAPLLWPLAQKLIAASFEEE